MVTSVEKLKALAKAPVPTPQEVFAKRNLTRRAYYADEHTLIFEGDARKTLQMLARNGLQVDCIVTSPPFYGQRDYGIEGQIGLELHPSEYIRKLLSVFSACLPVLKSTGSLWVNLGDTYWSGKGQHRSGEKKQSARRFGLRPQDRTGDGAWCRPKQLLLIPHRFAIAMQDAGWLVRNDNIWVKPNPIPDQVADRCSISHEYMFHFAKERYYYFNKARVGRRSSLETMLPPLDTWEVPPSKGNGNHKATFSYELIDIPIKATCPPGGIVLDPFAGSGTALVYAKALGYRAVGIDISREYCELMVRNVSAPAAPRPLSPPNAASGRPTIELWERLDATEQAEAVD